MTPLVGRSKPAMSRSVVVLPEPEGPSSEKNSPGAMVNVMPSTARTSPNRFSTLSSATAAVIAET
jgi:hypothetical protein